MVLLLAFGLFGDGELKLSVISYQEKTEDIKTEDRRKE